VFFVSFSRFVYLSSTRRWAYDDVSSSYFRGQGEIAIEQQEATWRGMG